MITIELLVIEYVLFTIFMPNKRMMRTEPYLAMAAVVLCKP
jgi:hypothetical protein